MPTMMTSKRSRETAYLDGLLVKTETGLGVDEELLDLKTVIALELNHLAHTLGFGVTDDGAIAGCAIVSALVLPQQRAGTYQTPS